MFEGQATMTELIVKRPARRAVFFALMIVLSSALALFALMIPALAPLSSPAFEVGQVAPRDILAPRPVTYASQVLTAQQRESAARNVSPIYTAPDTAVARRQLENLRTTLAYIHAVRVDPYATAEQKLTDLAALEYIQIGQDMAQNILNLSDSRWQAVQQEAIVVLEQVMRSTIREDRLEDVRRTVPTLISLSLPEDQARIVSNLVTVFVTPNSLLSEELTQAARQKAAEAVQPAMRSYVPGETVVQRGQVISLTDLEALQQLGLVQPEMSWKDLASAAGLVLVMLFFMVFYLRRNLSLKRDPRGMVVMACLFLVFLFGERLLGFGHTVVPYLYPMAAYSLTVAVLYGAEPALITSLPLAILAASGQANTLELTLYYALGSFFGVLVLGRARRVTPFFKAGIAVAACGTLLIISYRLPQPLTDWIGIATLIGASFFSGIASAGLSILLQFFLAQLLGMTTSLQLMELSRPDHPLLQLILRNSPGTYQHSLQVANLAEQAAERIGADPLLTRVGALYHDVGKAIEPAYFIENQVMDSTNPHDELDPQISAQVILRHIAYGLELAKKYRLPTRIRDFICEHHGTMITRYQYVKAVDAAGGDKNQVDPEQFRYPGPRPRSRETAILMLADGSEARVRADHPKDEDELRRLIKNVIDNRLREGQLDETDLTLRDLNTILDSFTSTLRGIYHPRIQYPALEAVIRPGGTADDSISPKTTPLPRPPDLVLPAGSETPATHS